MSNGSPRRKWKPWEDRSFAKSRTISPKAQAGGKNNKKNRVVKTFASDRRKR